MTAADSLPLRSAGNRAFILRIVSRYGALFLLVMHIPFGLAIGPAYWLNTVMPSAAITCLHFLMPLILPRFGPLVGAMWLLSVSMLQTFAPR